MHRAFSSSWLPSVLLVLALGLAGASRAGTELGPLPPGAIAHSEAGPADELIGYLLFDPRGIDLRLPDGLRLRTLEEKSRHWPRLAAYLETHPDRREWAWSFFEIIRIHAARYDEVVARFGPDGGMAVWYPEVAARDARDARARGTESLAVGSWISDAGLVATMRARGFPAQAARVSLRVAAGHARGALTADGISIRGECRLEGPAFVPDWGQERHSYDTFWTPAGEGDTLEVATWSGHRSRRCVNPRWRVTGSHPFARLFNDPARGDTGFLPTEFAFGYQLRSALYPRHPDLYARIDARLAADPALADALGKPTRELESVDWLLGDWDVVADVRAQARRAAPERGTSHVSRELGGTLFAIRDEYPSGSQDLGFLGFDPALRQWTSIGLDSVGNAIITRGAATGPDRLVLEGDVTVVGVAAHLRQTIERQGDDAYLLTNEERTADGAWRLLDTYRYTRRRP